MQPQEAKFIVNGRTYTARVRAVTDIQPNVNNTNRGKPRGLAAVGTSLQTSGAHRGIFTAADGTIVGGNHVYESAVEAGVVDAIIEIESDGGVLVSTKRIDWKDAKDPKAVLAGLADNRTSELNYDLDPEMFALALVQLEEADFEIPATLFTDEEMSEAIADLERELGDGRAAYADSVGIDYQNKFAVAVECRDAAHQEAVYNELVAAGHKCRILTV